MNYLKDEKALGLLQDVIEKSHVRDIKVLETKAKNLTDQYNKMSSDLKLNRKTKDQLERLLKELERDNEDNLTDKSKTIEQL